MPLCFFGPSVLFRTLGPQFAGLVLALGSRDCSQERVRVISIARLRTLPPVHLQPIYVVVFNDPIWKSYLEGGFVLRCFQHLSLPDAATRQCSCALQPIHRWSVQHGPLVLVSGPRKFPTPTTDRDRTVSRRSEPSSRATLIGEQPNPWDLLQPRDVTSRHRGAKPLRRYELLGGISLLSPEYLLSFERWPFHAEPPDHYALVSYLFDLFVSQSSALVPLHSATGYQSV